MKNNEVNIQFGVVHGPAGLRAWEYAAISQLLALPHVSLAALISTEMPQLPAGRRPLAERLKAGIWRRLYRPAALRPAAVPPGLGPAAQLHKCQLDFILHFGSAPPAGPLLAVARLGVWAFRFGQHERAAGLPVGLAEIAHREPTTVAALCQYLPAGPALELAQGTFRTQQHSPAETADSLYTECAHWPADVCRAWQRGHAPAARPGPAAPPEPPLAGRAAGAVFWGRVLRNWARYQYQRFLCTDQWNIGVVNRPIGDFLRPEALSGAVVEAPELPGRNVFYADCFGRLEADGLAIYFEHYDYRVRRGRIARLPYPWRPGTAPTMAIRFPFHLSYPFLFGPYCLPEAATSSASA